MRALPSRVARPARSLLEAPLIAGMAAAPLLPLPAAALALFVLSGLWLLTVRRSREPFVAGPLLAAAVLLLGAAWAVGEAGRTSRAEWVDRAREGWEQIWVGLRQEARAAAASLPSAEGLPLETPEVRLAAFRRLAEIEVGEGQGRRSLLLVDPDGVPVAWAGEGLLHELPDDLPRSGFSYRSGFTAVTLLAVEPLDEARRPWRVVAGASFPTDRLPFEVPGGVTSWSVAPPGRGGGGQGALVVRSESPPGVPALAVKRAAGRAVPEPPWARRLAWGLLGAALLAAGVLRELRRVLPGGAVAAGDRHGTFLLLAGLLALGAAAAVPPAGLATLAGGALLSAVGLWARGRPPGSSRVRSWLGSRVAPPAAGAASVLLLIAAAWGLQRLIGPLELSDRILVPPGDFALRLGFAAAAFGLFSFAGAGRGEPREGPAVPWAWLAAAFVLAGAAATGLPLLAAPLLAGGGAAAALFSERRRFGEGMALAGRILLAALVASACWEMGWRLRVDEHVRGELLDRLAAPTPGEMAAFSREIRESLGGRDLQGLVPRTPRGLERQDLAYALWRESPLARRQALSSLEVQPFQGEPSSFSYGLPLPETPSAEAEGAYAWDRFHLPLWDGTPVSGSVPIRLGGRAWGTARYRVVPRPGFRPRQAGRLEEVEVGLLRGGPGAAPVEESIAPALYALYTPEGRAALSPWDEEPPLSPLLKNAPAIGGGRVRGAVVETPSGLARAWARSSPGGWEVVYLPFLEPLHGLERMANSALGVLLLVGIAAPPMLLLALPRAAFRGLLRRAVRSYSKRLMIVYTALLLLPLLLLYVVLVRSMEDRLRREQRAAGEAALDSAQALLEDRLLELPPGFGVDTAFGDELLVELSEILHHEVNLYWGSGIHASSRHELFTAGLLPKRIPGETFSRLALLGYGLSSRTNRVGPTNYLEVYAPLRVPGAPPGEERLFLSIPLLAQQEEAARQLAQLRRQAFLVTAALFTLLVAVGRRLGRSFTEPLNELVEGTRRIAAGAPSLDLAPSELELAALVDAIDRMAGQIADQRERLVREKQVVERMVENITSGVVSLDHQGRVLMHNRVAADLLGVRVGERIEAAVEGAEGLQPVAAFLRGADGDAAPGGRGRGVEMARETVRLAAGEGGEREWSLVWVPVPGAGEPSALLVVEDVTEVLRSQRLLAWAEMARMIAHEIKNPLTPIRLSAEHMREVFERDPDRFAPVFERCTTNILSQVDELRSIASDFSAYSSIPRIEPRPADLVESMAELVEGYRAAPPEGVRVDFEAGARELRTRFDPKLLQRAVRNLLENALRATATPGGRVLVRVEPLDGIARISVVDSGPGVKPELLPRIFDPYFSTHDTGTGLGLPIARRIAEEHGGTISARNRPEGGLEVAITLPL